MDTPREWSLFPVLSLLVRSFICLSPSFVDASEGPLSPARAAFFRCDRGQRQVASIWDGRRDVQQQGYQAGLFTSELPRITSIAYQYAGCSSKQRSLHRHSAVYLQRNDNSYLFAYARDADVSPIRSALAVTTVAHQDVPTTASNWTARPLLAAPSTKSDTRSMPRLLHPKR